MPGWLKFGLIIGIYVGAVPAFGHCTTRPQGLKLALKGKTRATYVIRAVYMSGHVEFVSFDMDEYGLTEDQVLSTIQKRKLSRSTKYPGYGDIHSVRLMYSPKSPEHNAEGYLLIACQQAPEHRPKVLIQEPSGRR